MKNLTRTLFVLACSLSAPAFAQMDDAVPPAADSGECAVDADCPTGFTCETSDAGVCPACDPMDGACSTECTTYTYSYCAPPPPTPCTSDANCDGNEVCVSYSYETCSGSAVACVPDEPCPEPEPAQCDVIKEAYCVPPFIAPCQVDADCGGGFTCDSVEICACSGGRPDVGGGSTEPVDPDTTEPDCTCEPSGEKYCNLVQVECATDADCADGLTCVQGPSETVVSVDENGTTTMDTPAPPVSYCMPAGYGYWGGPTGGDAVAAEAGVDSSANFTGSDRIAWGDDGSDSSGSKGGSSSCSTASGDGVLSMLGLLGLVGLVRRRK